MNLLFYFLKREYIIAAIQGRCCCMIASARDNLYKAKASSSSSGVMTLKYLPRDPSPRVFWSAGHCSSSLLKKKFFSSFVLLYDTWSFPPFLNGL